MKQEDILLTVTREYMVSGLDNEKNKRYNAATSSLFKALVGICDLMIFKMNSRMPDNHTERFEILEKTNERIYKIVNRLFRTYRNSYTRLISKEEVRSIKNGIKNVIELGKLEKEFTKFNEKI